MLINLDAMSPVKRRIVTALLFVPVVLAAGWLGYIKSTEVIEGFGQGNFLSPVDTTKYITVLVIFLFVYVFFVGMIFFDRIEDFIVSRLRK